MDKQPDEFRVRPVTSKGVSPAVPIVTFLVGLFLGAAIIKPWDLVFTASVTPIDRQPTPTVDTRAEPTSSPMPSGSRPPAECMFAGGWRVFALGQPDPLGGDGASGVVVASADPGRFADVENPLRRWLEVDPLTVATGPADRRIPFVAIVSDRIGGIGYCPPADGRGQPPAGARLDAWVLDEAGVASALPLRTVKLAATSHIEVPVFIGADHSAGGGERWADGRYIFAVESPDAGYGRWFGVEIRTPPGRPLN